ncbi:MAG: site-2 protease family protein [Clostridia bacterium]|nr:site-2 protease family protein [Clostridia bacterium]
MTILYVLLALVLLGVLITVHEFGHFAASRLCGIPVKEFSIGFGPKLLQWKSKKHETLFSLRPIPLGGFCMFYGDTDDDPEGKMKDDPRNYNNAPVWKRMISVFAGPAMNFVLAFVVAVVMMTAYGVTIATPYVASVDAGKPAAEAGLLPGDQFVSVRGQNMTNAAVQDVSNAIGDISQGEAVDLTVLRDGEEMSFTIQPRYNETEGRYMIGITIQQGYADLPGGLVIPAAWNICKEASTVILNSLGKLITTGEGLDQTAGPVGVVQMVAEQTQQGGLEIYLYLTVIISINLGLMNLLPIPGLDGSRLIFMLVEAVRRKPVDQKIEAIIHLCGYALLFGLMIYFTFKDVLRIFQG